MAHLWCIAWQNLKQGPSQNPPEELILQDDLNSHRFHSNYFGLKCIFTGASLFVGAVFFGIIRISMACRQLCVALRKLPNEPMNCQSPAQYLSQRWDAIYDEGGLVLTWLTSGQDKQRLRFAKELPLKMNWASLIEFTLVMVITCQSFDWLNIC